jgi:hypothetical protein
VLERTLDIMDKVYQERSSEGGDSRSSSIQISNEDEQELYNQLQMYEHSLIYDSIPILRKIVEYRRLKKLEGMDLRKYINPASGRIHCNMNQIGTATSRFSSSTPNTQQISARTKLDIPIEVKEDGTIVR